LPLSGECHTLFFRLLAPGGKLGGKLGHLLLDCPPLLRGDRLFILVGGTHFTLVAQSPHIRSEHFNPPRLCGQLADHGRLALIITAHTLRPVSHHSHTRCRDKEQGYGSLSNMEQKDSHRGWQAWPLLS